MAKAARGGLMKVKITNKMLWQGAKVGLKTTWELAKVVVPTSMVVAVFQASGLLDSIIAFFTPYMGWFGLSGEAAVVLFSGYFINLYAAAGSILALNLSPVEISICAIMLVFCHSLLIELPISKKAGSSLRYIFFIRLASSLLSGFILGVILT